MHQALNDEPATATALPPYSGEDAVCAKCSYMDGIFTAFRPACARFGLEERNGVTGYRGPLPERLERSCGRCDYTWDEALDPADPEVRPATVLDVAYALERSHDGWALEISPGLTEHIARVLLEMTQILVRVDHPVWQPAPPRAPLLAPPAVPAPSDAQAFFLPGDAPPAPSSQQPQQPGSPQSAAPTTTQTGPLIPPGGEG